MSDITRSTRSRLAERLAYLYRIDQKSTGNGQGLFEYFQGVIGAGSIGTPDVPAKIKVMPLSMSSPSKAVVTLQAPELHIFTPHGSSGFFKPMPSGFAEPIYEILVRAYFVTETNPLTAGAINTEDAWARIRYVTITGDNARVPGKLLDPDNTANELNINIPEMVELTPQGKGDITIMEMMIGYQCREATRTGVIS